MTRAKEELYLSHARMRDFRGNTVTTVPSMFLDELPESAIQAIDAGGGIDRALDHWRGGGAAAEQGWSDAGIRPKPKPIPPRAPAGDESGRAFVVGMLVHHAQYGNGRIVDVSGQGSVRRVKIRFSTAGERTFIADKVNLEIIRKA
jgi:DNA helicase-2/ATP-dependent DNA helicase PcrA